ncbi:MAG: peptide deformylase [Acidobacteriota bacterium]
MIRTIVKYPDPRLKERCKPVTKFDGELRQLAADMLETMYAAPGVGLAAPQVGETVRLIVVDVSAGEEPDRHLVLVNPELVEQQGTQKGEEGCLSIPGVTGVVERPARVLVRAQDLDGKPFEVEGEELMARILCHEIDHLDGILYLDRLSPLQRELLKRKIRKLMRNGEY